MCPANPLQCALDLRDVAVDVSAVNQNTSARVLSMFWVVIAFLGLASPATAAATSSDGPSVVVLGANTYSITRAAKNGFHRDVEELKALAMEDATRFCAARGKQLKVVSMTQEKPWFSMGYCKAKIVFKALDAGDPELAAEAVPVSGSGRIVYIATSQAPAPVVVREKPLNTSELYAALTQLDDLRKKGILTEEEFQSEKQKVLKRSQ